MTRRDPAEQKSTISADDLAVGLRILADLLDAGMPLTQALHALSSVAPRAIADIVPELRAAVREGSGLARALDESSEQFPPIVTGLVRAGEAGSGLPIAMRRAADYAEQDATTRAALQSALAYPVLVAVAGVFALALMLGVVLPRFAAVLGNLQQTLPPLTQFVVATAALARNAAAPALVLAVVAVLLLQGAMVRADGRRAVHRVLLAVPGVGTVRWANATARFAAALSALLESGVTLRQGLRHASAAIGDDELAARLDTARKRLDRGESLGRAFEELRVVTPVAARLVAAGEESGRLPGMLAFAAKIEFARADRLARNGVRLVEPSLILVIALIVAVVAAAMLQAIYAVGPA